MKNLFSLFVIYIILYLKYHHHTINVLFSLYVTYVLRLNLMIRHLSLEFKIKFSFTTTILKLIIYLKPNHFQSVIKLKLLFIDKIKNKEIEF